MLLFYLILTFGAKQRLIAMQNLSLGLSNLLFNYLIETHGYFVCFLFFICFIFGKWELLELSNIIKTIKTETIDPSYL